MANLVFRKDNNNIYTVPEYQGNGTCKLNVLISNSIKKFGFTSNASASAYSPSFLVGNKVCYLAKSFTSSKSISVSTTSISNYNTTRPSNSYSTTSQSNYNTTRPSNSYSTTSQSNYNTTRQGNRESTYWTGQRTMYEFSTQQTNFVSFSTSTGNNIDECGKTYNFPHFAVSWRNTYSNHMNPSSSTYTFSSSTSYIWNSKIGSSAASISIEHHNGQGEIFSLAYSSSPWPGGFGAFPTGYVEIYAPLSQSIYFKNNLAIVSRLGGLVELYRSMIRGSLTRNSTYASNYNTTRPSNSYSTTSVSNYNTTRPSNSYSTTSQSNYTTTRPSGSYSISSSSQYNTDNVNM